jgi:hypothetical protein
VVEDEAATLLHAMLPSEWIVRRITKDYGIDYEVEIAEDSIVTGNRLWIQLKGCEKTKRARSLAFNDGADALSVFQYPHIVYDADTALLKYALKCDFPLLLALADLSEKEIYWVPLRDEIEVNLDRNSPDWRKQAKARVRIDPRNKLSAESRDGFYGLKWYARQPARSRAAARLHLCYHEMSYECSFNYEVDDDGNVYPQEVLEHTIDAVEEYLGKALEIEALFGDPGWDAASVWKEKIVEGLRASHVLRAQLAAGGESFRTTSVLIGRMGFAHQALSSCIADIERINEKFILNPIKVKFLR